MKRGNEALANKSYAEAIILFRSELKSRPKPEAEVYYQLGRAYQGAGDRISAYRQFRKALEAGPPHAGAQLAVAELLVLSSEKENREEAGTLASAALHSPELRTDAENVLALKDYQDGDRERAKKRLVAAFEQNPAHLRTAILLVSMNAEDGNVRGGQEVLERLYSRSSGSRDAALALARFYAASREYRKAEQVLSGSMKLHDSDAEMLKELAQLQLMNGKPAEAEQSLGRLVSAKDRRYRTLLPAYLYSRGRRDAAVAALKRIVDASPGDREARTRLIGWYMEAGQNEEASRLLEQALEKNSRDTQALLQRAQLRVRQNRLSDASNDVNQVARLEPESALVHQILASIHAASGKHSLQMQELSEALRLQPAWLEVRLQLASLLSRTGDPKAAMSLLNEAKDEQKSTILWQVQRNNALLASGDLAGARKGVDQGLAVGRTRELLLQDAEVRLRMKDTRRARASAEEVLANYPEDASALRLLSQSLTDERKPDEALLRVRQHAANLPDSAPVQHFFAGRLDAAGKLDECRTVLESIVSKHPEFTPARFELYRLALRQGRFEEARRGAEQLARLPGTELPARLLLADAHNATSDFRQAVEQYRRALDIDPQNANVLNNVAYLLVDKLNDVELGLTYAQRAKELAPADTGIDDTIGWAYYRKGLYSSAVRHLEAAASRSADPVIRLHLGLAYQKLGRTPEARKLVESAVRSSLPGPEMAMARSVFPDLR